MKKAIVLAFIFFIGCKNSNQSTSVGESKDEIKESSQATENSEWQVLFDGTSLDKWRGYLKEDMPEEWIIEEGVMVFAPSGQGGKNIITKEKFTNFILSLEWKISEGGNSGIFWGVFEDERYGEPYQTGPEIQVLDNERHPDAKANPKYHQAGALYDMVQPEYDVCKPAGEWNLCVLEVNHKTNKGSVTLNGTKIVSFPVHGSEWDSMVENSKFKKWDDFGKYQDGHIGLQDHGDKVSFRNIKIKEL